MNTDRQGSTAMDRQEQMPPIGDLIKLTGFATVAFLLLIFLYLFVLAVKDRLLGQASGEYAILLVAEAFLAPMAFIQFLPWMERYGLNSFSGKSILWTALSVFFAFVLVLAINCILSYMPVLTPEYWMTQQTLYGRTGHSGIGFTLIQPLIALFHMAQMYAVLWCSFTLVQKLRGFVTDPNSSVAAQERAASVTRWSFILTCSIGIVAAQGILTSLLRLLFGLMGRAYDMSGASSPYAILLSRFCVNAVTLFIAAVLIHALTANRMPKRMPQVRPEKLFFSFALVCIFLLLAGALCNLLGQWVQNSRSNVQAIILWVIIFIAATLMCKKVLVDYIQTVLARVLALLLIFLPVLLFAIKRADNIASFSLLFGLIFSLITPLLFFGAYSIKLALRIVYGEPEHETEARERV